LFILIIREVLAFKGDKKFIEHFFLIFEFKLIFGVSEILLNFWMFSGGSIWILNYIWRIYLILNVFLANLFDFKFLVPGCLLNSNKIFDFWVLFLFLVVRFFDFETIPGGYFLILNVFLADLVGTHSKNNLNQIRKFYLKVIQKFTAEINQNQMIKFINWNTSIDMIFLIRNLIQQFFDKVFFPLNDQFWKSLLLVKTSLQNF